MADRGFKIKEELIMKMASLHIWHMSLKFNNSIKDIYSLFKVKPVELSYVQILY